MKIAAALLVTLAVWPATWPVGKVTPALVRVTNTHWADSECSGFAIDAKRHRFVTASHCVPESLAGVLVDNEPAVVILRQPGADGLTVVASKDVTAKPLALGPMPRRGEDILLVGFGGGSPMPLFYEGVSITPVALLGQTLYQFTSAQSLPGMSGCPIVNRKGQVVGVLLGYVQPTDAPTAVSFSPLWQSLNDLVTAYGPKAR